jgi:hypothetical protein
VDEVVIMSRIIGSNEKHADIPASGKIQTGNPRVPSAEIEIDN